MSCTDGCGVVMCPGCNHIHQSVAHLTSQHDNLVLVPLRDTALATHGDRESSKASSDGDEPKTCNEGTQTLDEASSIAHNENEQRMASAPSEYEELVPLFTSVPEWMEKCHIRLGSHWRASVAVEGEIGEAVRHFP